MAKNSIFADPTCLVRKKLIQDLFEFVNLVVATVLELQPLKFLELKMDANMKVTIKLVKNMDKELLLGQMDLLIQVFG